MIRDRLARIGAFLERIIAREQRALDVACVWHSLTVHSRSEDEARRAMLFHARIDSAYRFMSDAEKQKYVAGLPY